MSLELNVKKKLGDFSLNVDLSCKNEVLSFLGESGSGKSVTLKCIAGILKPDSGRITVDDRVLFDSEKHVNLSIQKRRVGMLFQNYALFPNMTVAENIRMGLKRDGGDAGEVQKIVERFGLTAVAENLPSQISGGQQQRTALARILISKPDILMLDEPFSALDAHLRFRMEAEVRSVIREFGKTVILVSHNRDEVFRLSDRVAVLKDGSVDVSGTRDEIFRDPKTRNAATLTGCKNISPVKILDAHHLEATDWGMELTVEKIPEQTRYVGIRMHYIYPGAGENTLSCTVEEEIENPFSYTLMLKYTGAGKDTRTFGWEMSKEAWRSMRAKTVEVHIPQSSLHFLER